MKKSLFILHLSCLFLFNFNYSSEEVTKSATKQVIVTLGYGAVTTGLLAWTHKESIVKATIWAGEALCNQWSHKKTQQKVDKTHDLLEKEIKPEMTKGFAGLKGLVEKTKEDTGIMRPYVEDMSKKIENIHTTTQSLATTINNNNQNAQKKIEALLNSADKHANDYLMPIKKNTEESLKLNKQIATDVGEVKTMLIQIQQQLDHKK